jgi:hypothetical protein
MEANMEFDITMRVVVDLDLFSYSLDKADRESHVLELVHAAMYDCDDIKVLDTEVEEISDGY